MKRVTLIVNPYASGVTEERVQLVEEALGGFAAVETRRTEGRGHATELARDASRDAEGIVVYSGDGGFNEVLNGFDGSLPLGFIPGGGTSVLPRALGLPRDPVAATRRITEALAAGRTRTISLGSVNGRRFGFSAGVGLDAELVRRVERRGRSDEGRRAGDLAFALTLARVLAERRGRFDPKLQVDGAGRAAFALVANAGLFTYLGGVPLRVAPTSFEDGLDLVAPTSVTPLRIPGLLARLVRKKGLASAPGVIHLHDVDHIRIVCDRPLPLQADGEDLGDVEEAVFESKRNFATVLV